MNGDKKHPYVKWYGRDWIGDTMLRMCTPEERGIWIDLLCLMMDGNPYGHLAINGEALTDEETARVIGCDVATFKGILYRIEKRGIASRTEAGMLYSRRLVRDHKRFIDGSKFGKKGGGNPALHSESEKENTDIITQKPEAKGSIKGGYIGQTPPRAGVIDENEAMREICRIGYGWDDDGEHKHKLDRGRHRAFFACAVAFMVRGGLGMVLKPTDFATYVHSYFGKMEDDFYDLDDEKSLPRYAVARIGALTDNDLAKYGTRYFEFIVKDFNGIFGLENDAAFKKHRAKQIEIQNRRAER
jgi:hypothetical protein